MTSRGSNLLDGGDGDDLLAAGFGSDVLLGGRGRDQLVAASGDHHLTGGADADRFYVSFPYDGEQHIEITDFTHAAGDGIDFGFNNAGLFAAFDSDENGHIDVADAFSDQVGDALVLDLDAARASIDPFSWNEQASITFDHISRLVASDFLV